MPRERRKRDRSKGAEEYYTTLNSIAFGDYKYKLHFDDIEETEDGWEPIRKWYERKKCLRMYERNSTMSERKGLRIYK